MFASPGQTRILTATRNLVRRHGYAAVSLRRIAAEAGYSPAGLYAHYPSLGGILDALADVVRQELAATLQDCAAPAGDAVERLVDVAMAYMRYGLDHPTEFELLFRFTQARKKNRSDPTPSSFDLLRRLARRAAPQASAEEIDSTCLGLWASAHGLANLRAAHLAGVDCDWEDWSRRILHNQVRVLICTGLSS